MMSLQQFAKKLGVCYKTAWRYWDRGELNALQTPTGRIIVECNIDGDVREGFKNKGERIEKENNGDKNVL